MVRRRWLARLRLWLLHLVESRNHGGRAGLDTLSIARSWLDRHPVVACRSPRLGKASGQVERGLGRTPDSAPSPSGVKGTGVPGAVRAGVRGPML